MAFSIFGNKERLYTGTESKAPEEVETVKTLIDAIEKRNDILFCSTVKSSSDGIVHNLSERKAMDQALRRYRVLKQEHGPTIVFVGTETAIGKDYLTTKYTVNAEGTGTLVVNGNWTITFEHNQANSDSIHPVTLCCNTDGSIPTSDAVFKSKGITIVAVKADFENQENETAGVVNVVGLG